MGLQRQQGKVQMLVSFLDDSLWRSGATAVSSREAPDPTTFNPDVKYQVLQGLGHEASWS